MPIHDPSAPGFAAAAAAALERDGFAVIRGVLGAGRLTQLQRAAERAVREICALDPLRQGNAGGKDHRYSFGRACKSGFECDVDWATMIDVPAVSAVLTEFWGDDYLCNGLGGDFSLPGATVKQGLHSDIGEAQKYEVIDSPEARSARPRHYGANNANLMGGRGRHFAREIAYDAPEAPGTEYLHTHNWWDPVGKASYRDPGVKCGVVNVDFVTVDLTPENGPTQLIAGSHHWPMSDCPTPDAEPDWMRLSTMAGLRAGAAVIRDLRLFHAGTPNVSRVVRPKPAASFVAPWWTSQPDACPMTRRVYRSLSAHGRRVSRGLFDATTAEEHFEIEWYPSSFFGAVQLGQRRPPWPASAAHGRL